MSLPGGFEALHRSFPLARRLMRDLGAIVRVPVLPVFDAREYHPPHGRIAFHPVRDAYSRDVPTAFKQLPRELLSGRFIPAVLDQRIWPSRSTARQR
jgi:hypothetical protein